MLLCFVLQISCLHVFPCDRPGSEHISSPFRRMGGCQEHRSWTFSILFVIHSCIYRLLWLEFSLSTIGLFWSPTVTEHRLVSITFGFCVMFTGVCGCLWTFMVEHKHHIPLRRVDITEAWNFQCETKSQVIWGGGALRLELPGQMSGVVFGGLGVTIPCTAHWLRSALRFRDCDLSLEAKAQR